MELIDVYCFYIYIINAFQPASLAGWDPCWWEGLWMKQRFYLTSPAWRPDGRLECSQGDGADLFICPSCILLEYHLPSHPLFKGWEQLLLSCTLRLALSLPYLLSLSPLHPPLLPPPHIATHFHSPCPLVSVSHTTDFPYVNNKMRCGWFFSKMTHVTIL